MSNIKNEGLECTYQLEPRDKERFFPSKVRAVVQECIEDYLEENQWEESKSPEICEDLTRLVRKKVKLLKMPRYKLIVQVVCGALKGQGIRVTSKCLWDPNFDNFCTFTHKEDEFYITVMVFGVYHE